MSKSERKQKRYFGPLVPRKGLASFFRFACFPAPLACLPSAFSIPLSIQLFSRPHESLPFLSSSWQVFPTMTMVGKTYYYSWKVLVLSGRQGSFSHTYANVAQVAFPICADMRKCKNLNTSASRLLEWREFHVNSTHTTL